VDCGKKSAASEVEIVMMKRFLAIYALLILSAMLLPSCSRPSSEMEGVAEIGRAAPDFTLPDLGGQEISLDQFKGKIVLLDFWATWCGPCRMTMPLLERLQNQYSDVLVQLAINMEEPLNDVREYVRSEGIHARVLLDEDGSVSYAYRVGVIPMQILIDRKGIVRHVQAGFDPGMSSQLRSVIEELR
jgi:thiol-disulfide isomerase/thioredoxin